MILIQTQEAKLVWTASFRDSQILAYPTLENAIGNPSHISRILNCSELHTVAEGFQKGVGVMVNTSNFLWHLRKSKELLDQNIELLEWDYSVSFPDVGREQQKSNGGKKGDRRVGIQCKPHGYAIMIESILRGEKYWQVVAYRDARRGDIITTDDKGPFRIHRRRAATSILAQLHFIISFLQVTQGKEISLIPNPNDLQLADSIVVK
jgi:hypothetical protein